MGIWKRFSFPTLEAWTRLTSKHRKPNTIDCCPQRYSHYQDRTDVIRLTLTLATSRSGDYHYGRSRRAIEAPVVLFTIIEQVLLGIRHNTTKMFRGRLGCPTSKTVSRRISVYYLDGPRHDPTNIVFDVRGWKLTRWRLQLSDFDLEAVHWAGVKHHEANRLSSLQTTTMNEYRPKDNVLVLMIT